MLTSDSAENQKWRITNARGQSQRERDACYANRTSVKAQSFVTDNGTVQIAKCRSRTPPSHIADANRRPYFVISAQAMSPYR